MKKVLTKDEFRERIFKGLAQKQERKKEGVRAALAHTLSSYYRTEKSAYRAKHASQRYY